MLVEFNGFDAGVSNKRGVKWSGGTNQWWREAGASLAGKVCAPAGCLMLLEILEIFWKFAKSPGNFLAEFVCLLLL